MKEEKGLVKKPTFQVSDTKIINKMAISTEDEKYLDFDYESAVQTPEFMGKHIAEFKRGPSDDIPEILTLLFDYFDEHPEHF